MIDLKDIKAGDEVQIANGDWFEVVRCTSLSLSIKTNGVFRDLDGLDDLITDHRQKFDWSTAKSGMCFIDEVEGMIWFVGDDFKKNNQGVFALEKTCSIIGIFYKESLKRHPEGDINND